MLERFAYYDRAAKDFAIVQTGERRLYGNIILKKGIIAPKESDWVLWLVLPDMELY